MERFRSGLPLALAALFALSSCSRSIGWGVVLWDKPEARLAAGELVKVYFKSTITKTYAVGVPSTGKKAELEAWSVEFFGRKSAAASYAREFAPLSRAYATVLRDGLIIRDKPANTAAQVYRLRLKQEIKLLEKTEGERVETGGQELKGDWYLALTDDGVQGYVFSNQLSIHDLGEAPALAGTEVSPLEDPRFSELLSRAWRPAYFADMISGRRVDLGSFDPKYGLFIDSQRMQARLLLPEASWVFDYTDIGSKGAAFTFEGSDLTATFPSPDAVVLHFSEEPSPDGITFIDMRTDLRSVISAEETRRMAELAKISAGGERFESPVYGVAIIPKTGRVTWLSYEALVPAVMPRFSGDVAQASVDVFLPPEDLGEWDGGLSFHFENPEKTVLSFAYKVTKGGLRLAWIPPELISRGLASGVPPNPTILEFGR